MFYISLKTHLNLKDMGNNKSTPIASAASLVLTVISIIICIIVSFKFKTMYLIFVLSLIAIIIFGITSAFLLLYTILDKQIKAVQNNSDKILKILTSKEKASKTL
jgi:hypothetical protein